MTARFFVVLHSATVPSSDPVIQVSLDANAHDSNAPSPGAGRKMSCESSATFQNRHVRSLPTVTTRSRLCPATHATSDWCPNSVSTYAMSSKLHTLSVRSSETLKSCPVPSRIARLVTAPRCDANSCTCFCERVSHTCTRLSAPAVHSRLRSCATAQQSNPAAPHRGGAIGPPPPLVGSTVAGGARGNFVRAPVSTSHRQIPPSFETE